MSHNRLTNLLYNRLCKLDNNLNLKPDIAKSWRISKDHLSYTFYLNTQVYFTDHKLFKNGKGRKINAQDFLYSLNRLKNEHPISPGNWISKYITSDGIQTVNDSTLKIILKRPYNSFLYLLTLPYCSVIPKESSRRSLNEISKDPIGTGAFKLVVWDENNKLVLTKNKNYYKTDKNGIHLPYIEGIAITFIKDKDVEILNLMNQKLDVISGSNSPVIRKMINENGGMKKEYQKKFYTQKSDFLNTEYIGIIYDTNHPLIKHSKLKIKKVRQAMNYSINKLKMVRQLRNNIGKPAKQGFVHPNLNYRIVKGYEFNLKKAKQLMLESKIKTPIKMKIVSSNIYKDLCIYIQEQWGKIGINLEIEIINTSTLTNIVAESKASIFRKSWIADYANPESFLSLFYSENKTPNGPNYTLFKNKLYDKLYKQLNYEKNKDSIKYISYQLDSIIIENAPIIPLIYDETFAIINKRIENLNINSMNIMNLEEVEIK